MIITVLSDVADERERQDAKWGEQNHAPELWQGILGEEMGEVCKAVNEIIWGDATWGDNSVAHLEEELIQVAAVAVAWVECLRRHRP